MDALLGGSIFSIMINRSTPTCRRVRYVPTSSLVPRASWMKVVEGVRTTAMARKCSAVHANEVQFGQRLGLRGRYRRRRPGAARSLAWSRTALLQSQVIPLGINSYSPQFAIAT